MKNCSRFYFVALSALFVVPFVSCLPSAGPSIVADGFTVKEKAYRADVESLKGRAAFEFSCPKEQLSVLILNVRADYPEFVKEYGVSGCEKKAVFVWVPGTSQFVMNSTTE